MRYILIVGCVLLAACSTVPNADQAMRKFTVVDEADGTRQSTRIAKARAGDLSPLVRIEAFGIDTLKVGRVTAHFAGIDRGYARQLAVLSEAAAAHFERELGASFPLHLVVLRPEHWFDPWSGEASMPYGMPWGWIEELLVTVPASLGEGVLILGPDDEANRRRVQFVMLHEFGHLANKRHLHPDSSHPYSSVRWFEELLATYFAYSYIAVHDPEWAQASRREWLDFRNAYTPAVLSLDWGFMRELPPEERARTYAWYQILLNLRVAELYEEHGLAFLRAVRERLPWERAAEWTTESLLPLLEEIAPGFETWASDFQSSAVRGSATGLAEAQPSVIAITRVTVVDVTDGTLHADQTVLVKGDRIAAVGSTDQVDVPDRAQIVDGAGGYLIPGLADMHTHFGTGVRPPGVDDTTPVLARLLYYGVTTTLNLGSFQASPGRIDSLRSAMKRDELHGPRLLAAGALITVPGSHPTTTIYSPAMQAKIAAIVGAAPEQGPINLAPGTDKATTLVRSAQDMRAEVRRLGEWGADAIKIVVESGPDGFGDNHPQMPPGFISAAVKAARRYSIPVLCHVSSLDELEACLEHGAAGLVHAVPSANGLPKGIEQRMAAAGMALIPTASLFDGWARYAADRSLLDNPFLGETLTSAERKWLGSDQMRATFASRPSQAAELANLRAHLRAAHDAGVLIVAGTDVGNPYRFPGYGLHEELAFYVSAGLTPAEALATATVNAARLVGDENEWGSIREGLAADLVILDRNPLENIANTRSIRHVIRAGRVVDRAALPVR